VPDAGRPEDAVARVQQHRADIAAIETDPALQDEGRLEIARAWDCHGGSACCLDTASGRTSPLFVRQNHYIVYHVHAAAFCRGMAQRERSGSMRDASRPLGRAESQVLAIAILWMLLTQLACVLLWDSGLLGRQASLIHWLVVGVLPPALSLWRLGDRFAKQ
jgi:hypothetical protein